MVKKIKTGLWIIITLLLIATASAELTFNATSWWNQTTIPTFNITSGNVYRETTTNITTIGYLYDDSGNGHTLTNSNARMNENGYNAQSSNFTGSEFMTMANTPDLHINRSFTIIAMVRPTDGVGTQVIYAKHDYNTGYHVGHSSGRWDMIVTNGTTNFDQTQVPVTTMDINNWGCIAWSREHTTGNKSIYAWDSKTSGMQTSEIWAPNRDMRDTHTTYYIGRRATTGYFKGDIDEIFQWNTTLTPNDINTTCQQIINQEPIDITTIANASNLVFWHSFDDLNNTILHNITIQAPGHVSRTYNNHNTSTNFTAEMQDNVNRYLTIYALDWEGNPISSGVTTTINHTGQSQAGNPFLHNILNYINITQQSISALFTTTNTLGTYNTYSTAHTINRTNYLINYSLSPYHANITFVDGGTATSTYGYWNDLTPSRQDFNTSNLYLTQYNLSTGKVMIRYNGLVTHENYTQYYEYINDYTDDLTETIELIDDEDWSIYFKILNYENNPMEDVVIRAEASKNSSSVTNASFIGQRLTKSDGTTFFIVDATSHVTFTISKDDYTTITLPLGVMNDHSYGINNPLEIYLVESSGTVYDNSWVYCGQNYFRNRSQNINCTIVAKGRTSVSMQTPYRQSLGLTTNEELTCDNLDRCPFTLLSGTHFNNALGNNDNITMQFYFSDSFWGNRTLVYVDPDDQTSLFGLPSMDTNLLNIILVIALMMITLGMRLIFKSETIGVNTYLTGSVLLTIISPIFAWLYSIALFYIILKTVKRLIV